eukprot:scaffold13199_cov62-Attheya_sp.AAC.4
MKWNNRILLNPRARRALMNGITSDWNVVTGWRIASREWSLAYVRTSWDLNLPGGCHQEIKT